MALDFGILQPANISGQLQAGQESDMRNQLAQQQLAAGQQQMETGRMQQEKAGLEMQQFRRRQSALDKFLSDAEKGGHTGDPEDVAKSFFDFAITSGDPSVVVAAQQALMAAKERKRYLSERMPKPPAAAPAMPVAPGALGSGTFDLNAAQPAPVANTLAPAAAAPANALAGPDTKALENEIFRLETQFANVPEAQKEAARLKERLKEFYTPRVVGNSLIVGNKPVYTAPPTQTDLRKNFEFAKTPEGGNYKGTFDQFKAISAPKTTNIFVKQEAAFESGLGKGQSERILANQVTAQDAAAIIDTVKTGRDIMKSGMITGAGAEFLVNLNQGLKTVGIDAGYADASANSQAFAANMANNVGKLIKQFGAGTGLSNADREYAEKMAGSKITLDSKAINRILDINERAARNVITRHNKDVKGIKTNIPLEVEMPPEAKTPVVGAPSAAIEYLRANPAMKDAFDAKYGAGAADRALKGQ